MDGDRLAIETHALTKRFDEPGGWRLARATPITAVHEVTLSVRTGELFGLLGPNGAGKTTLVKMLCTLIAPTSGTLRVTGHDLHAAAAIRANVGLVVSDERSFYWRLTAEQNLRFFAALYGLHGAVADARVAEVLAAVDLTDRAHTRFSGFSTGMKQRLAIARGLLHRPKLLFLDEPSRSLDPVSTTRLHDLIRALIQERGMTTFLITHDLAEAEKLCHRIAVMHHGRIRAIGEPETLRRTLQPQRSYAVSVDHVPADLPADLQPLVDALSVERGTLHLRIADEDDRLDGVLALLRARRVTVRRIDSHAPTLEELFARLTTGE